MLQSQSVLPSGATAVSPGRGQRRSGLVGGFAVHLSLPDREVRSRQGSHCSVGEVEMAGGAERQHRATVTVALECRDNRLSSLVAADPADEINDTVLIGKEVV
jgi:hypothetical protein